MTLQVNGTTVINLNRSITLGTATPSSPTVGLIRWNSSLSQFEVYDGTAWFNIVGSLSTAPLWSWGENSNGQLGDLSILSKSSPVSVIGRITDWVQVASGESFSLGIRANGTAWAWGRNLRGQLGDNTTVDKSSPVNVLGGFTDWTQISGGNLHTAAIRANGTIWCWGRNLEGQLGTNSTTYTSSPVSVVGGFTDWTQVSAGQGRTMALRANGTIWGWGGNATFGQLGDNTTVNKSSPVSVVGGFTDWIQISAGTLHTTALRSNGTAWAWGGNNNGRLGDNTTVNKSSPVSVVGGFTNWIQISAGNFHTAAIRSNGTAWSWGGNYSGSLGDNTTVSKSSPVSVVGGFTDWIQVAAGNTHTIAIRANGTAWAWGSNSTSLSLGDNTAVDKSSPVSVVGGFTNWTQIGLGGGRTHTIGLRSV